jgi:hypothetical protein
MSDAPLHETLRRLFDVIVAEAGRNPAFAQRLAQVIGQDLSILADPAKQPASRRRAFVAPDLHAVNVLRLHGEGALRGRLEQVKAVEDLRSVAKASGLVLSGNAARPRPSRTDLIQGIIDAAKHYDELRSAATA